MEMLFFIIPPLLGLAVAFAAWTQDAVEGKLNPPKPPKKEATFKDKCFKLVECDIHKD